MNEDEKMVEYRPRVRLSRKHPVSRNGRMIVIVAETEEQAQLIQDFVRDFMARPWSGPSAAVPLSSGRT